MFKIVLVLFVLILIFVCLMHEENHHLTVTKYKIQSAKLPKAFDQSKFVLLTDLHNNSFGENNEILISRIKKENPDYIMVSGDMLIGSKKSDYYTALNLLTSLSETYPIYYVNGNHEQRLAEMEDTKDTIYKEYQDILVANGIHMVNNETINITKEGESIAVTGLVIDYDYYHKFNRPIMTSKVINDCVGTCNKNTYTILLAHNPMYFDHYATWGADLVLSGHVHGGIMRLPFLGGVISPQYILFPKYDGGRYEVKNSTMLLSRGLGVHTLKIRIFNRPELIVFTMEKE